MVVTIWCAIGTERAGVFAGKMAIGAHLVMRAFSGKQGISGNVRSIERFQHQV